MARPAPPTKDGSECTVSSTSTLCNDTEDRSESWSETDIHLYESRTTDNILAFPRYYRQPIAEKDECPRDKATEITPPYGLAWSQNEKLDGYDPTPLVEKLHSADEVRSQLKALRELARNTDGHRSDVESALEDFSTTNASKNAVTHQSEGVRRLVDLAHVLKNLTTLLEAISYKSEEIWGEHEEMVKGKVEPSEADLGAWLVHADISERTDTKKLTMTEGMARTEEYRRVAQAWYKAVEAEKKASSEGQ